MIRPLPAGRIVAAPLAAVLTGLALAAPGCVTAPWAISRLQNVHPSGVASLDHRVPPAESAPAPPPPAAGERQAGLSVDCERALRHLEEASPPRAGPTAEQGRVLLTRIADLDPIPVCRARALRILGRWAGRPDDRGRVASRLPLAGEAETIRGLSLDRLESDESPLVRGEAVENLLALGLPEGGRATILLLARRERDPLVRSRILDGLAERLLPGEGDTPPSLRSSLLAAGLEAAGSPRPGLALAGIRLLEALQGRRDVSPTKAAWVRALREADPAVPAAAPSRAGR